VVSIISTQLCILHRINHSLTQLASDRARASNSTRRFGA
jgi:hypothetical protein